MTPGDESFWSVEEAAQVAEAAFSGQVSGSRQIQVRVTGFTDAVRLIAFVHDLYTACSYAGDAGLFTARITNTIGPCRPPEQDQESAEAASVAKKSLTSTVTAQQNSDSTGTTT